MKAFSCMLEYLTTTQHPLFRQSLEHAFSEVQRMSLLRHHQTPKMTAAIARMASTTLETEPTTPATRDQFSPSSHPAPIRRAFHAPEPSVVRRTNRPRGISERPAGTEMRLRTPGTILPKSTTAPPYLSNPPAAPFRSASFRRSTWPWRRISSRPPHLPSA